MTKESILKRKLRIATLRRLANKIWEDAGHVGDVRDFEYFFRGFLSGYREASIGNITTEEKDKIWVDYMVSRVLFNKSTGHNIHIVGIDDFHKEYPFPIRRAQDTDLDNFESWNWKHNVINKLYESKTN